MALKATIYKAELQISDMRRHYYQHHSLTLAKHPSETEERVMVRVLAFALNADEHLSFSKGLSAPDEPDIWQKNLTGEIKHWIEVGRPELERLRKACGRARLVSIYTYGGHAAELWWQQLSTKAQRFDNLRVYCLSPITTQSLATLMARSMMLQCTLDEGSLWLGDATANVEIELTQLLPQP